MTKTALRALPVVVALVAAVLLTGASPALASGDSELQGPGMCTDPVSCPSPDNCAAAGMDFNDQPLTCVARQLPGEHEGAQLDCPDGSVGTVHAGVVDCRSASAAPTQATPAAQTAAPAQTPVVGTRPVDAGPTGRTADRDSGSAWLAQLRDFLVEWLTRLLGQMTH